MDTTAADSLVGKLLSDRYRVRRRLAQGGMATVYEAIDTRLERIVAIKIIHPSYAVEPQFRARFDREAKTAARLTHPNVVAVFDSGQHGGLPYLVMEYVPGRTLRDVLVERGRLSPAEALAVAEPMLAALTAAHQAGLVHRDIKPENILISEDRNTLADAVVKVADFGLARAVELAGDDATGGQLMATVAYVPPELVRTGHADKRSDVYSAGIVLFEMLTGTVPFHGQTPMEVAYQHVEGGVPAASSLVQGVAPELDELVTAATCREPNARPVDAVAFLARLRDTRASAKLDTVPLPTRSPAHRTVAIAAPRSGDSPPADREASAKPRRHRPRRRGLIGIAILVALALVAGVGGWWLGAGRYTEAPSLLTATKRQAVQRAQHKGFHVAWGPAHFSESQPKGTVLSQDPEPGGRILSGGTIAVSLSKGPERYTIPRLVGHNVAEASGQLREMHLNPSSTRKYDPAVSAGTVLSVSPKAGTVVRRNASVKLVVSKGPAPVTVADVIGKDVDSASDKLTGDGLKVTVKKKHSQDVDAGEVLGQSPAPGTGVDRDTNVTLTVSSGPPMVTVPDVTGMDYGDAKKKLEHAGFSVKGEGVVRDHGTVRVQSPDGGKQAAKGSTITLYVL